jgi:hypothetical protein
VFCRAVRFATLPLLPEEPSELAARAEGSVVVSAIEAADPATVFDTVNRAAPAFPFSS